MDKNYSVKRKHEGKFLIFGNVKKNQYGNYSLGMKVTPLLRQAVESAKEGEWLNFSLFEDNGEKKAAKTANPADDTDSIQF